MITSPLDFLNVTSDELTGLVGRVEYIHKSENQSGTAYPSTEGVSLLLFIPSAFASKAVRIVIFNESLSEQALNTEATIERTHAEHDVYRAEIPSGTLTPGLYYFRIKIESFSPLYGFKHGEKMCFSSNPTFGHAFQLTVFEDVYSIPTDNLGGIIYHIFVDRFNRGGSVPTREDATLIDDWYAEIPEFPAYPGAFLKNNYFYGGTLWGIINKLDYLKSLGVSTIYLSPIFEAYSNHKYDTGDYSTVDAMFGGESALRALIAKAKEQGIGIILDGVFNHTGSDSIYFNRNGRYDSIGAYQSTDSAYYTWYDFQSYPDKYTSWWGIEILPRINPDKPACSDYFIGESGIIRKYAKMGINGIRLDVADELSDTFIAGIKAALNEENPKSILYGEVWEDASCKIAYDTRKKYYLGRELDGVMNYPIRTGIIDFIADHSSASLKYALTEVYPNMPKRARDAAMNLLGTHDTERILTRISGVSSSGYSNATLCVKRLNPSELSLAVKRLKMAYTIIATLPGIPSIYYGDEAGIEGYSDPFNRRTYPWGRENVELLDHYRRIGAIRRENTVYREGEFKLHRITDDLLIFERCEGGLCYLTVANNSTRALTVSFDKAATNLYDDCKGKEFIIPSISATVFLAKEGNSFIYK